MRASIFAAVVIMAAFPASAGVLTIGGSFAEGCFHAAESRVGTLEALSTCDRAFAEQALTADDEFATYVNRGIVKMHRGEFSGAQSDFDRAVALNLKRGEPWLNMGVLKIKQGDSRAAIPLFGKALELGTDSPEVAYYGRAMAFEDVGDLKSAYFDLRRAVELSPRWSEPMKQLARYQVRRP
jgi:tetratricopeptide (TPR) repeat protein